MDTRGGLLRKDTNVSLGSSTEAPPSWLSQDLPGRSRGMSPTKGLETSVSSDLVMVIVEQGS